MNFPCMYDAVSIQELIFCGYLCSSPSLPFSGLNMSFTCSVSSAGVACPGQENLKPSAGKVLGEDILPGAPPAILCPGVSVPSWSCVWKPRVFPDDARECQCPFVLFLHSQGGLRRGVRASGSPQLRTGKSGSFNMGHKPRGLSRISSRGRPHPEGRRAGREPLPDHAGESTLLSRTGEE